MRRIISISLVLLLSVALITVGHTAAQANGPSTVSTFIGIADNASKHITMLRDLARDKDIETVSVDRLLSEGDVLVVEARQLLEMQDLDSSVSTTRIAMSKFLEALDNLKESLADSEDGEENRLLDSLERQKLRMLAIRRAASTARDVPQDVVSAINSRIEEVERKHSEISQDGRLAVDHEQAIRDLENARANQKLIIDALRDEEMKKLFERYQSFIILVETELERLNLIIERARGAEIDVSRLEAKADEARMLLSEVKQSIRSGEFGKANERLSLLREIVVSLRIDIGNLRDIALDQRRD